MLRQMVIAIDGPSASGKTTTARAVARRLRLRHIDTGAMYRAITFKALRGGADLGDGEALGSIAEDARIDFVEVGGGEQTMVLDGEDVSRSIRSPEITRHVSSVSAHAQVRRSMVRRQRALANGGGVVLEGRDIGSVVLPCAHAKVYLDASIEVRAQRRRQELQSAGTENDLDTARSALEERDRRDSTRSVSPLTIPIGARIIDTSALTIDEQVGEVLKTADEVAERILGLHDQPAVRMLRKRNHHLRVGQVFFFLVAKVFWGLRVIRKEDTDYAESYIYACNHRSNADPPLVGSTIARNVFFVAKRALFKTAFFAWVLSKVNTVPIRRATFDREALDVCLALLEQGHSILIFPEGGRSKGSKLREGKPGAGYLALKSGRPVYPVYVDGTLSLKKSLFRRPHLTVIHGRPMRLTDTDLSKYQETDHFRDFGVMVMRAIEALQDEHDHPPV